MKEFHISRAKRTSLSELEQGGGGTCAMDFISVEERQNRLVTLTEQLEAKIKQHIPRSRNLELVVLKCHLLLEFMFEQYIDLSAPTEGVINKERFTFKQKESLVHMLGYPPGSAFFPTVDLLNKVRNSVAHTLTVDRQLVDKLIRINSEAPSEVSCLSDVQRVTALKNIIKFMCWELIGVIEAQHYMKYGISIEHVK